MAMKVWYSLVVGDTVFFGFDTILSIVILVLILFDTV